MADRTGIPCADVRAVGVKRFAFGTAGKVTPVVTNHFEIKIPRATIYQYNGETMTCYDMHQINSHSFSPMCLSWYV